VHLLPRFPSFLEGTYKNGIKGSKVKVIWPADLDNNAVLKPGQDTVFGRVAGTNFKPKAIISIKQSSFSKSPVSTLKTFELKQVSLKSDVLCHLLPLLI